MIYYMPKSGSKKVKNVLSVGFSFEDGGIFDDRDGIDADFEDFFRGEYESQEVNFEEGVQELVDYVRSYYEEVEGSSEEEKEETVREVKKLCNELWSRVEKAEKVVWKVWNVEYDLNLGVEVLK